TVYGSGFIIVALGYGLYPMCNSVIQLYIVRGLFAVGVAMVAVMLSACIVDYIQERSRGRWVGIMSIFNGLGVVTMSAMLTRLPNMYKNAGNDSITSGLFSFWTVAALCLVIGVVLYLGLFRGTIQKDDEHSNILSNAKYGLEAGFKSPRLAIAYAGAFIGRGDFAVIGAFFSLWLTQAGIDQGMSTGDALKKAGLLFAGIQICALMWAPIMGLMADKMRRMTVVPIGLAIAGTGYVAMSFVADPFGPWIYPAGIILGMGETSVIVSVAALLGQESNLPNRGSIVGAFSLLGGLGIFATVLIGGHLFDGIGRTAPFMMMGLMNFALMLAALWIRSSQQHTENAYQV
ncbi:MAG: MFS transporter, partial [Gammaproteobacteria bacterium]|nr:MFS transporter [Gammaproteobacteria bacterium]